MTAAGGVAVQPQRRQRQPSLHLKRHLHSLGLALLGHGTEYIDLKGPSNAIAGQVLREKLERRSLDEARDAAKVVQLIEEGVSLTRRSAKGLHPVDMNAEGLMLALDEFALTTTRLFDVNCQFLCESPVLVHSAAAAEHLFRIAQEATRNAIQHGGARNIDIELNTLEEAHELRIADDGRGLPSMLPANGGLGLRIMAQRAQTIGDAQRSFAGPRATARRGWDLAGANRDDFQKNP